LSKKGKCRTVRLDCRSRPHQPVASGDIRQRPRHRIGGSIPLGELGGDRVVLSNNLKDSLLRAGRFEPYQRTYAKRQPKVVTQPVTQTLELSRPRKGPLQQLGGGTWAANAGRSQKMRSVDLSPRGSDAGTLALK
jgi:hypothetical protein